MLQQFDVSYLSMMVPASSLMAARRLDGEVMMPRLPPPSRNPITASTFGRIDPGSELPFCQVALHF